MIHEAQRSRRLPVYILADRSGSMDGDPIVAVNQGLQLLKNDLEQEPRAIQSVWISVVSFGSSATIDVPLTELMAFNPPTLSASGTTQLGEALDLLDRAIDNDRIASTGSHTGDYRPLVFLFTDGEPTDDWREPARRLKHRTTSRTANIIAVGCGVDVNTDTLKDITESVMLMENTTAGDFQRLLRWISQSVKSASKSAGSAGTAAGAAPPIDLPPPPGAGFRIVL